jgi:hypothetical protein
MVRAVDEIKKMASTACRNRPGLSENPLNTDFLACPSVGVN